MCRPFSVGVLIFVSAAALVAGCRSPETPPPQPAAVSRPAGSWQGRGSTTIGFVSDTGRFRVTWETRNAQPPGGGTFRLTVHSAVSGRPMEVIADHRGEGHGSADFADDPRVYNFMVDSENIDWSFTVDALSFVR
jgi:hypothetical protein